MAINQAFEQFNRFELLAPANTAINSGDLLIFGKGTKCMVGAQTSQSANNATGRPMMTTLVSSRCRSLAPHGSALPGRLKSLPALARPSIAAMRSMRTLERLI